MSSELEKLGERGTYTRGRVLKRAGIGVAAAWSVPLFLSTATAEAAVNRKVCVTAAFQHGLGPQLLNGTGEPLTAGEDEIRRAQLDLEQG